MHNKTVIPIAGWIISVGGWWVWTLALSGLYKPTNKTAPLYHLSFGFIKQHGRDLTWWLILLLILASATLLELGVSSVRKTFWPTDTDNFQVLQKDPVIRARFEEVLKREEGGMSTSVADLMKEDERGEDEDQRREGEIQDILDNRPKSLTTAPSPGDNEVVRSPVEFEGTENLTRRTTSIDVERSGGVYNSRVRN